MSQTDVIPKFIEELWFEMQIHGRYAKPFALVRLVRYWSRRSAYTQWEICQLIRDDVLKGWPVGLRKHGFQ